MFRILLILAGFLTIWAVAWTPEMVVGTAVGLFLLCLGMGYNRKY